MVVNVVDGGGATESTCKIEMTRETIWVSGNEARLRDLEFVELGTINLAELKDDTNNIVFDVIIPEGITNMTGESQVTVTVSFPNLAKKKLSISKDNFVKVGIPVNAEVVWITEFVEVELRGDKDMIKRLTEKDITITVDFTGEELGSVSKVPKITLGSSYSGVGAISVPAVMATLQTIVVEAEPDATVG